MTLKSGATVVRGMQCRRIIRVFVWMNGWMVGWTNECTNMCKTKVLDGYFILLFIFQPYRSITIERVTVSSEPGEVERPLQRSSALTGRGSWLYVSLSITIGLTQEQRVGHQHLHVY